MKWEKTKSLNSFEQLSRMIKGNLDKTKYTFHFISLKCTVDRYINNEYMCVQIPFMVLLVHEQLRF